MRRRQTASVEEGREVEIRWNEGRRGRLKRFFPSVRRYRATRRSLCAGNTDPYTINHCHPRSPAPRTERNEKSSREERKRGRQREKRADCIYFDSYTTDTLDRRCFIAKRVWFSRIFVLD